MSKRSMSLSGRWKILILLTMILKFYFLSLVLPHGQPGVSDQIEFESENFAVFFFALKIYHWDLGQRRKWTNSSNFFPNWTKVFTQKKKKIFYWIRKIQPPKILLCSPIVEHEKF